MSTSVVLRNGLLLPSSARLGGPAPPRRRSNTLVPRAYAASPVRLGRPARPAKGHWALHPIAQPGGRGVAAVPQKVGRRASQVCEAGAPAVAAVDFNEKALYIAIACACCSSFLFGFHSAVIAGTLQDMSVDLGFAASDLLKGLAVSAMVGGGCVGGLLASTAGDALGRTGALRANTALLTIGALGCALAPGAAALVAARFITGVGVGLASVMVPIYIAEIAPAERRGSLSAWSRIAFVCGVLGAFILTTCAGAAAAGTVQGWWRAAFLVGLVPCVMQAVAQAGGHVPETPSWSVRRGGEGGEGDARLVLQRVGGLSMDEADEWLEGQRRGAEGAGPPSLLSGWKELAKPEHRRALGIALGLASIQALSGSNSVVFYAPIIFKDAGLAGLGGLATIAVGVANLVMYSLSGMLLSVLALALAMSPAGAALVGREAATALATVATPLFLACFAAGAGPVPYLIYSEVFRSDVRSVGASLAGTLNWAANMCVGMFFLSGAALIGMHGMWMLYGGVCAAGLAFVALCVRETKGQALDAAPAVEGSGKAFKDS